MQTSHGQSRRQKPEGRRRQVSLPHGRLGASASLIPFCARIGEASRIGMKYRERTSTAAPICRLKNRPLRADSALGQGPLICPLAPFAAAVCYVRNTSNSGPSGREPCVRFPGARCGYDTKCVPDRALAGRLRSIVSLLIEKSPSAQSNLIQYLPAYLEITHRCVRKAI